MDVILSSLIIIIFGSILFAILEASGFRTRASDKYAEIIIPAVWKSKIYIIILTILHFLFSILCLLYIFNFILLTNNNYDFIIFKISQRGNFIFIIFYFCISFISMFFLIFNDFKYNKIILDYERNLKNKRDEILESFINLLNDLILIESKINNLNSQKDIQKDLEKMILISKNHFRKAKIYLNYLIKEDKEISFKLFHLEYDKGMKIFKEMKSRIEDKKSITL